MKVKSGWSWFKRLVSGKPHFIIGDPSRPYLLRWYIFPRNPILNLYLHKFMRDDDDRALHDHPWWFLSLVLRGSYEEVIEAGLILRSAGSLAFRRATHRHRVRLLICPTWTLVLTGRVTRKWGFWCPRGFVPWQEFTKAGNPGEVGPGCGD